MIELEPEDEPFERSWADRGIWIALWIGLVALAFVGGGLLAQLIWWWVTRG